MPSASFAVWYSNSTASARRCADGAAASSSSATPAAHVTVRNAFDRIAVRQAKALLSQDPISALNAPPRYHDCPLVRSSSPGTEQKRPAGTQMCDHVGDVGS